MGALRRSSESSPSQAGGNGSITVLASSAGLHPQKSRKSEPASISTSDLLDTRSARSVKGGKGRTPEAKSKSSSTTFLLGDAGQSSRFLFPSHEEGLNPNLKDGPVTTVSFGRKHQSICSLQGKRSAGIGTGGILSLASIRRPNTTSSLRLAMQNLSSNLADVALSDFDNSRSSVESPSLNLSSDVSDESSFFTSLGLILGEPIRDDVDSAAVANPLPHSSFLDRLANPNSTSSGASSPSWDDLTCADADAYEKDFDMETSGWLHEEQGQEDSSRTLAAQIISQQESVLEDEIIAIITSGSWESLLPNSGQSVPLNGHHVCVEYREEGQKGTSGAGGAYRTWEWHGHLMVYDGSFGYNAEYVYGNYFEPLFTPLSSDDEGMSFCSADVASPVSPPRGLGLDAGVEASSCRRRGELVR